MSGRSAGFALPSRDEWRRALAEWARSDGATWIYVFKVLCAAFLTLWLAMRLELPQPSTATITVFIVMQPQSGQVFAKSFYRILGTLVGLSVMVTLIALFAQERVLFLLSSAIWIGLCTAGAARYRDFRSYACVLAGYTATLIGIPATSHPEGAFMQAIWRVLEISLAILCSGVVSAVIMPQTTSAAMRNALYVRFGLFAAFVLDSLRGVGGRERFESSNVAFAAQAVGLETMRAASAFEDPHMRLRNGRLIRLSSEFMAMNTRFHALHQLLERLRAQGSTQVLDAFEPCLEEITGLLEEIRGRAVTDHDAERFAQRLADCRERLMARIRQARGELLAREPGEEARLDFNTAAELLYRFAEEMHDYALTHASLAAHRHEREQWKDAFTAKANAVAAAVAGMRTGLMILLFGCFWIYSTWPSGGTFALNAVAVSALASAAPNPKKVAMQMAIGTMAAALLGFSEMFFVYPHIDGFPLLCLVLAPVFALGAFISSRPQWAGYGLGLLVFFCFGSVPANLTVYDPAHVINEYIALILSMLLSAAAAAVILPPNSAWLWKRLERDLRMRVVFAISGRSRGAWLGLRKRYPRPAEPGLWRRRRAPGRAARAAALDVPGARGRPRDHRAASRAGAPAGRTLLRRGHALAPGDPRHGAGPDPAVRAPRCGEPGARPGGCRPGHPRGQAHRRTLRAALRQLAATAGAQLPALHPFFPARADLATDRTGRPDERPRYRPCLVKSPSMGSTCRP